MSSAVNGQITVLNPPRRRGVAEYMALPGGFAGKSVGFPGQQAKWRCVFGRVEQLLREKYEIPEALYRRKPTASIPAESQVIEELAARVQVAVVGLGD